MPQRQAHLLEMLGRADLHMHSIYSDGIVTIEQILEHVEHQSQLDVIAITDHDTIEGALRARDLWSKRSYRITASGSTALALLVKAVATQYESKCSGAMITVNLGGSKTGLANVEAGSVDIGDSDIPAASNQSDLVDHQVAVVIFGIIVNKDMTLTNITTAQLKQIYSGQVKNWSTIGGPNLPIVVVSRPASSGTRATFQKYILGGPRRFRVLRA